MNNIAFIFPGQGAQYVGMGKELSDDFPAARQIMDKAQEILDIDLEKLCYNGPKEKLDHTSNTQPAIFTVSMMVKAIIDNKTNLKPAYTAGHSLGEYSALTAAGVFNFSDALRLVRKRGLLMDEALPAGLGSMAAIIKLEKEKIEDICSQVEGICEIANYNSPMQIVISGEKDAIDKAIDLAQKEGALKAIELDVSGPFHSSLMKPARDKLAQAINRVGLKQPDIPIVANASAQCLTNPKEIKENLLDQLTSSVRWQESMELLINKGVETFIEVGPGKVLRGLMRRIDRSVDVYNIQDVDSLEKTLHKLNL